MPVGTFHVQVSGRHLRVLEINVSHQSDKQNDPMLVFLHEGLGCIELWKDFPQRLCKAVGMNGLVYDRKGYGGSDSFDGAWPKDYLIEEATEDLPKLMESRGIKSAILIGHSDGGSIALLAAAGLQHLIKGAIAEAAHIFVEDETVNGILRFIRAYNTDDGLKKKLFRYHGKNTDRVVRRWADRWLSPDYCDWNIECFLPQISCPLLVLQGENDEYASVKQVKKIVDQVNGPVSWKIISKCGHTPHLQSSGQVLNLMSEFIFNL